MKRILTLALVLLTLACVNAQFGAPTTPAQSSYLVTADIYQGWNYIDHFSDMSQLVGGTLQPANIHSIYILMSGAGPTGSTGWAEVYPNFDMNTLGLLDFDMVAHLPTMIYSDTDGTLNYEVPVYANINQFSSLPGFWSLNSLQLFHDQVPIATAFAQCPALRIWAYDTIGVQGQTAQWFELTAFIPALNLPLTLGEAWPGILLYDPQGCVYSNSAAGTPSGIMMPPPFP
ncbi:hypothetical protein GF342_05115 [Candidatus Woesearchaeota archaeon]|nr:hypothetical protein [Candidatus Woesearchaeota archaeon]